MNYEYRPPFSYDVYSSPGGSTYMPRYYYTNTAATSSSFIARIPGVTYEWTPEFEQHLKTISGWAKEPDVWTLPEELFVFEE